MVYAGKNSKGDLCLNLELLPGIPGNGVASPGQELTGGLNMLMALVPPQPKAGRQQTIDYLVDEHIKPFISGGDQLESVQTVISTYEGLEPDVIFCLSYALQGNKLFEAIQRLKCFHKTSLSKSGLPSWMRCTSEKTFEFFKELYKFVEAQKYK